VASWLVHLTLDQAVQVEGAGWGHCVGFLGKTLYSHSIPLHPGE